MEPNESPAQHTTDAPQVSSPAIEGLEPLQDYLDSIGEHLFGQEARLPLPTVHFTLFFGPSQRARCLELIVDFCQHFSFKTETLLLAVGIFQRLCVTDFQRYHLSLRTCTSLYMASKYAELAIPRLNSCAVLDPSQQVDTANILRL